MIYTRGSIRHCVKALASLFRSTTQEQLAILCHPRGKYYSVVDDAELASRKTDNGDGDDRLLFRGTEKELRLMTDTDQQTLFPEQPDASHP